MSAVAADAVSDVATTGLADPPARSAADQVRGSVRGRAEVPLSILDLSPIGVGQTPSEALATTTGLAQRAEEWGYHRFWVAEHHGMPGVASSAPAVLLAHLGAATRTIRLGAGGVMLPNHATLVVAEQFGMLHALHPGRIDLGLGRATNAATVAVLGRPEDSVGMYPRHIAELAAFLDDAFPAGHRYAAIRAVPGRSVAPESGRPPIWLLGASGPSAQLAGAMGLPFAFAHHFSPRGTVEALEMYRESFKPSAQLDKPYALISVTAIAAETTEQAYWLSGSAALLMLLLRRSGKPGPVPSPQEAAAFPYTAAEREFVDPRRSTMVLGDAAKVRTELSELRARTGADELMITGMVYDRAARYRSFELIAQAYGMIES